MPAWSRTGALLVLMLGGGACDSFEVEDNQFAIISVPTTMGEGGQYTASPTAFFFEGVGVRLASTLVGAEGCIVQAVQTPVSTAFDDIDAGDAVAFTLGATDAVLLPDDDGNRVTYRLPNLGAIPFTPGDRITFSIPGAEGGFPARVATALTVPAFTPADVTLPAAASADLTVTWTPPPSAVGSAMFYSFKYSAAGSSVLDREIACVFADDGSGVVTAANLEGFRAAELRTIQAQRALITAERLGNAITHITSTLLMPVDLAGDI